MPAPRAVDPLLRFYGLEGGDARGRSLTEIWAWDDERLEQVHDYIQWLFPLREPSAFNPGAPVLTRAAIDEFLTNPVLRDRLRRSFERMLQFYGLRAAGAAGTLRVEPSASFAKPQRRLAAAGRPQPPAPDTHPDQPAPARPRGREPRPRRLPARAGDRAPGRGVAGDAGILAAGRRRRVTAD